jgi:hypothetical protein
MSLGAAPVKYFLELGYGCLGVCNIGLGFASNRDEAYNGIFIRISLYGQNMERITAVHAISRETYELKSVKYFFSYDTLVVTLFPSA